MTIICNYTKLKVSPSIFTPSGISQCLHHSLDDIDLLHVLSDWWFFKCIHVRCETNYLESMHYLITSILLFIWNTWHHEVSNAMRLLHVKKYECSSLIVDQKLSFVKFWYIKVWTTSKVNDAIYETCWRQLSSYLTYVIKDKLPSFKVLQYTSKNELLRLHF